MIGLFDSGIGGLTIAEELIKQLPQHDYVYFADTANAPYGEKTEEEIIELTKEGVRYLFAQDAELVILGCNTASAVALRTLQQDWLPKEFPNKKVLGIVVPTIEQVTGAAWHHTTPITTPISQEVFTVGVLATPITVETHAYVDEIHKRNASIHVVQQKCPGLAGAVERGDTKQTQELISTYTKELLKRAPAINAVLLGCTHYEVIADQIKNGLPENVRLYHQPSIVAESLKAYLHNHQGLVKERENQGTRTLFTSGVMPAEGAYAGWKILTK